MKQILLLAFLLLAIGLSSCSKPAGCVDSRAVNHDPSITVANNTCVYPSIHLSFSLLVGNEPFEINRIYNIAGYNTAFKQFQCYLSGIELQRPDLSVANFDTLYPLLKENSSTFNLGEVYVETFERLRFNVGVDPLANANIAAYLYNPLHPLRLQSPDTMHWNTTDGYIFLKMVGKVDRNGDGIPNENEGFDLQIGSNQLLRSIDLAINKDVTEELESIDLELDVEWLLNNVDLQTEHYTHTLDSLALATKIANNIVGAIRLK